jgi:3-hydroxyisobutyrate dehydrogenase
MNPHEGEAIMNLGYVGLGKMGGALARRLMKQHTLRAYDLRPAVVQEFAAAGAVPAQDLRALADQCDLIMTCLPTSNQVRDVIFGVAGGDGGLAAHLKPGSLIADMTTGDPTATRAMAAELKARNIDLIDAPVSGGPHGATAGTIAIMVGAPDALFARIKPILTTISPNIFHTGDVGTGHLMKLVNNVIGAGVRAITFEAIAMGIKNGLTLKTCAEVLHKGSARSYTTEVTLPRFLDGSFANNFMIGLMLKDVKLATQMGIESAAPMPLSGLVREIYQAATNEHGADADINSLIRSCERAAQVKVVP